MGAERALNVHEAYKLLAAEVQALERVSTDELIHQVDRAPEARHLREGTTTYVVERTVRLAEDGGSKLEVIIRIDALSGRLERLEERVIREL